MLSRSAVYARNGVDAWFRLHAMYGKTPIPSLLEPAIEQPRWAWQPTQSTEPSPGTLSIEEQEGDLIESLRRRGHSVRTTPLGTHPSAVQVIQQLGACYCAGSDPRAEGQAGGW